MLAVPPTLQLLRQVLKPLSQSAKQELAPVALSVAAVTGYAPPERVDAVKKIYRLLGLDAADVYSDLHSHTVGDGVAIVKPGSKEPQDFEILPDGESQARFELDSQRIDSVLNDTIQVSKVLGEIFANDDQTLETEPSHDSDELLPGLHSQFALLALELIQRDHWQGEEFAQLAGRFDLMPDGALEILNEWAFEQFDEPLIEEYDGYNLNPRCGGTVDSRRCFDKRMSSTNNGNGQRISPRERDAIIQSLYAGVVPKLGLRHIQVGRAREIEELIKNIDKVREGGAAIRFVIGEYGSGKTFFLNLIQLVALEKGLVVMSADLAPGRRVHATGGQARSLYAELARNVSTRTKPNGGAMSSIVERFISQSEREAQNSQRETAQVIQEKLSHLGGIDGRIQLCRSHIAIPGGLQ